MTDSNNPQANTQAQAQPIDSSPFPEVQWIGKRVMLATSDGSFSEQMQAFLSGEGMQVTVADSAATMEAQFRADAYDLLIIDTGLDGDGLALGHNIKMRMLDDFVPLLYVTAQTDELSLASCFAAGGDDLVTKPHSETLMFARINALLKMGGMYRQQFREREELAYYHAMMETEQRLAKSIFNSIVHQDYLDRESIQYTLSPMSIFNGDVLLAASTPNGHEYVLLGDFTGHGLTASVGTLPVSEIFYAMTAKGFTLGTIIGEINRRLKRLLPVGMFMATYAIDINPHEDVMSVWAGGIPDLLLRRADGSPVQPIAAMHLPLGIVDSSELDLQMEMIPLASGDRFYIYTDGVTESENADGQMFGAQALREAIGQADAGSDIFNSIMQALDQFRAGHEQSDDITLLEYTYLPGRVDEFFADCHTSSSGAKRQVQWSMHLQLDPQTLRGFDPRPLLTQIVVDVQGLYPHRARIYTVLTELINNAIDYGLLGLDPAIKREPGGISEYARQRQQQLETLEDGEIVVDIHNQLNAEGGVLSIKVADSGPGFDYLEKLAATDSVGAKGLQMLSKLSDELIFDNGGRQVTAICQWKS